MKRDPRIGSVYQRKKIWWISYILDGKKHNESSKSTEKSVAEALLAQRIPLDTIPAKSGTSALTVRCDVCQSAKTAKGCRRCENVKRMIRTYNLSQDVAELFVDKKIPCCICRTTENVCADHCHILGVSRGALCQKHNTAFAYLNEDPVLIHRLFLFAKYAQRLKENVPSLCNN